MEACINDIRKWMLADRLKINDDKTEFLVIGTRQQLAKVNIASINVGTAEVSSSSEVKNFGCWLDNQLKLDSHINRLCKSAFFHLYNIRRIRKFLSPETTQILVNAFVTSRLDYCNSILYGLPATELYKLQRVQNSAARLICNVGRFDHISPSLKMLHWLPIKFRIQFKILLITFKAIQGLAPAYLTELITLRTQCTYNLRSTNELLLQPPRVKTLKTLGDRSFVAAAPALWNKLPRAVRYSQNVQTFKKALKTHLFRKAYNLQNI